MSDNERQLLASARKGSVEAFEKLIESYQKKIYSIVLNACGNEYEASEMAQEIFVRVFKSLKYQQEDSPFNLSVYKAVRDVCKGLHGKMKLIS